MPRDHEQTKEMDFRLEAILGHHFIQMTGELPGPRIGAQSLTWSSHVNSKMSFRVPRKGFSDRIFFMINESRSIALLIK